MKTLLEVAEVDRNTRFRGQTDEHLQCALSSRVASVCLPAPGELLGGVGGGRPASYDRVDFAVTVRMERALMCRKDSPEAILREAAEKELEKAAGHALWYGNGTADIWIGNPSATALPEGATIGEMVHEFYRRTVGIDPTIHLGIGAALDQTWVEDRISGMADGVKYVVSPGYPVDGVAITGPVRVWAEDPLGVEAIDVGVNQADTEVEIYAALTYDPCSVVLRGERPAQTYVGLAGDTVHVYSVSGESQTVVWGDGTADGTIPAESDTAATHQYADPGTYTITVGSSEHVVEIKEN